MCRLVLVVGLIALEMLVGGCLPVTTSSPLGSTVGAAPELKLTGVWKGRLGAAADSVCLAFYAAHDGVRKIVMLAPPTGDEEGGWMVFEARGARLGGNTYLDAREIEDGGKAPDPRLAHVPVLYEFKAGGQLALYLIDEKAARAEIAKGAIAGTVQSGEFGDVTITATPATLDAFFGSAAGRALFTKPLGIFRRVD